MYHDFELEQIINEVSDEWKINPTQKEISVLIHLYRGAEAEAERIRNMLNEDSLARGEFLDSHDMVDVKPFEEIMQSYFREKYFKNKYKGLSVSSYFEFQN